MSSTTAAPAIKVKKPTPAVVTAYLLAYNLLAATSWAYVLYLIVDELLLKSSPISALYVRISNPLYFAQSLAILEIFHSLLGFVSSPVFTTAMQVYSRLQLVWGIFYVAPDSRFGWGFVLATTSWSLVEVPRYLFYAVSLISTPAYWQKFVRYSLFLILYPTGITGEVLSILAALPFIAQTNLFSYSMPNKLNFAFNYTSFLYFILATYVPGSYVMYSYMLAQRKKQLSPPAADAKKAQ